jgi:capsular polysaccharide biosynthesis protein
MEFVVQEISGLSVVHPYGFLMADDTFIVDEAIYPGFASAARQKTPDLLIGFEALPERLIQGTCLIYQNWGVRIWGHFLIFMLPRLLVAIQSGIDLTRTRVLVSSETPGWQIDTLKALFGLTPDNFLAFDPRKEIVRLERALLPEIPYRLTGFNLGAEAIFDDLVHRCIGPSTNRAQPLDNVILIDRRPYLAKSSSYKRHAQNYFELESALRDYVPNLLVVDPSSLSLADQVLLFWNAQTVIGEYSSALHNSVFGRQSQRVLSIGSINNMQAHICEMKGQAYHEIECSLAERFELPVSLINNRVQSVLYSNHRPSPTPSAKPIMPSPDRLASTTISAQWEITSNRINLIGKIADARNYLEVGVWKANTFNSVTIENRCGVDPNPLFDVNAFLSGSTEFHIETSDKFFLNCSNRFFDVIFLDGLHVFEQTFRDFVNSIPFSHAKTVWIIDDTCPSDFCSAFPDQSRTASIRSLIGDSSLAWHGDVFKLIFALHDFFPLYDFRTIVNSGNPQTIVARDPRVDFMPKWNSWEAISRLQYSDYLLNRELMRPCGDDEALEWLRQLLC